MNATTPPVSPLDQRATKLEAWLRTRHGDCADCQAGADTVRDLIARSIAPTPPALRSPSEAGVRAAELADLTALWQDVCEKYGYTEPTCMEVRTLAYLRSIATALSRAEGEAADVAADLKRDYMPYPRPYVGRLLEAQSLALEQQKAEVAKLTANANDAQDKIVHLGKMAKRECERADDLEASEARLRTALVSLARNSDTPEWIEDFANKALTPTASVAATADGEEG